MESITDTWRFPDLNPIENLWHKLKGILWQLIKPTNKEELVSGIKQFWDSVIPQKCQKYIQHLEKVVPAVIRCQGKAFGFWRRVIVAFNEGEHNLFFKARLPIL